MDASRMEENVPACTMFLAWLITTGHPSRLRVFWADGLTALVVPPLQTLCHLILAADIFTDAAIAAVCQLRSLKTLKLASRTDLCKTTRNVKSRCRHCSNIDQS